MNTDRLIIILELCFHQCIRFVQRDLYFSTLILASTSAYEDHDVNILKEASHNFQSHRAKRTPQVVASESPTL